MRTITNVIVAGLGGQGVITASDILAHAAFASNFDVKKSDVHGMAQRGGPVASEVRYGRQIYSPLIPDGAADFLLLLDETQLESFRRRVRPGGLVISPVDLRDFGAEMKQNANIALLALLFSKLDFAPATVEQALLERLKPRLLAHSIGLFRQVMARAS